MAMLFSFDVQAVAKRSRIVAWIRSCSTVDDCHIAILKGRAELGTALRPVENLPRHEQLRGPSMNHFESR